VEWQIPICDGVTGSPSFSGPSSFSYSVAFDIDNRGYTTRTINGVLEIALTREQNYGRRLIDSVDNYKGRINFQKPANFERRTSWQLSDDKRSAHFTIIDSEIASPNAWPAGVVHINATHRAGWQRSSIARISNTISATIELSPNEHKARAWMIFRGMCNKRISYAVTGQATFIDALDVIEEIFENRVSFQLSYRIMGSAEKIGALGMFFQATGLFQPVSDAIDTWEAWDNSVKNLQPFRGLGTDRGVANLVHDWQNERIIDLCYQTPVASSAYPPIGTQPPLATPVLCNPKPDPNYSWLVFDSVLTYVEHAFNNTAVEIKANDLQHNDFNPNRPDEGMAIVSEEAQRFVDDMASRQEFTWKGHAERVGYPVVKPGRLKINGQWYRPIGKGLFAQKFLGFFFCQPKYAAAWNQRYVLDRPLTKIKAEDANGGVE
jgi:hypothetical protein